METFIAARVSVDNRCWAGVPFFLRTGKRMAEGARIVSIAFREPPKSMFPAGAGVGVAGPDHLTFDLADTPRLSLSFYGKRPGPGMHLEKASMQFSLGEAGEQKDVLEAYERLIDDAMTGDRTLFTTAEGVERLWEISEPLLEHPSPVRPYAPGSLGAQGDRRADRAEALAPAVRAQVARDRLSADRAVLRFGEEPCASFQLHSEPGTGSLRASRMHCATSTLSSPSTSTLEPARATARGLPTPAVALPALLSQRNPPSPGW